VQFSGSEGVDLLLSQHADDGTLALAALAAVKLLAMSAKRALTEPSPRITQIVVRDRAVRRRS